MVSLAVWRGHKREMLIANLIHDDPLTLPNPSNGADLGHRVKAPPIQ